MDMSRQIRVGLLIYLDHSIEKSVYPFACTAYSRHHRHTEKPSQLLDVQPVTFSIKFIIHIQGHHNPEVHVYELGGKIKIPLKVGGVDDIDDYIRNFFDKILPHI